MAASGFRTIPLHSGPITHAAATRFDDRLSYTVFNKGDKMSEEDQLTVCEECGCEYDENLEVCPDCGKINDKALKY